MLDGIILVKTQSVYNYRLFKQFDILNCSKWSALKIDLFGIFISVAKHKLGREISQRNK